MATSRLTPPLTTILLVHLKRILSKTKPNHFFALLCYCLAAADSYPGFSIILWISHRNAKMNEGDFECNLIATRPAKELMEAADILNRRVVFIWSSSSQLEGVSTSRKNKRLNARFLAPAELPDRLKVLCAFANQDTSATPYIPPLRVALIAHFMFGYDHHFTDGNGRTARTAFYWLMLQRGYWLSEFFSDHFEGPQIECLASTGMLTNFRRTTTISPTSSNAPPTGSHYQARMNWTTYPRDRIRSSTSALFCGVRQLLSTHASHNSSSGSIATPSQTLMTQLVGNRYQVTTRKPGTTSNICKVWAVDSQQQQVRHMVSSAELPKQTLQV